MGFSEHVSLFGVLVCRMKCMGRTYVIAEDHTRETLSYGKLLMRSVLLADLIAQKTKAADYVGLMLPNTLACVTTFFGMQLCGRVPVMLNPISGKKNILAACDVTCLKVIYTSKQFVEKANLSSVIAGMKRKGMLVVYLEELVSAINYKKKIKAFCYTRSLSLLQKKYPLGSQDDAAVVLFTSGSESVPKAVILSHNNLLSNCRQLGMVVGFNKHDRIFNPLPLFHAFGLTAGMLLPIFISIPVFLYPSPLDYRLIPKLVHAVKASVLLGTNTFLSQYLRFAKKEDFASLRYVFSGAEPLKKQTAECWFKKFGRPIYEGYGVTEASPVIALNTSNHYSLGTVGWLLPDIAYRFKAVDGVEKGGRLEVRGPNIMKGYMLASEPGQLVPPKDGWHDTGDIAYINDYRHLVIQGRVKRFAKIAGEMVSLAAVESYLAELWPGYQHAVLHLADPKKGESLVLATNYPDASRDDIIAFVGAQGISPLLIPRKIVVVPVLPMLGVGKLDYAKVYQTIM